MKSIDLFLRQIRKNGQSAVFHNLSGTTCPCVNSQTGYCDREWHRNNPPPGDEDCNGTGIISTTDTDVNIKALFLPKVDVDEKLQELIGLKNKEDFFFMGAFNVDDGGLIDISVFNNEQDYILFDGDKYLLLNIDNERIGDNIAYYYALMKRIVN